MSKYKQFTRSAVLALAMLRVSTAAGVTYPESPAGTAYDSHDLSSGETGTPNPETAFSTATTSTQLLDAVTGTIAVPTTSGISENDLYKIYIANPAQFSASTMSPANGNNGFDTQLTLFNVNGTGVATSDDYSQNGQSGPYSVLPAGNLLYANLTPGFYLLGISGGGTYSADSAGNALFPNQNDGTKPGAGSDPTAVYGPTSTEAMQPIRGYNGLSNQGGAYRIALTGVDYMVPEPSVTAGLLLAGVGLAAGWRSRRKNAAK